MSPSTQAQIPAADTEFVEIPETELRVSRVALGTWAMGGVPNTFNHQETRI
jgi:aryl-alcohol dehydrogenase-like predicted oxidoreductase